MTGHVDQCVERYCELANVKRSTLKSVSTPCIDDHQLGPDDFTSSGKLSAVAARIVLKCLFVSRMQRPDCLWSVNTLAREVTRWNAACDKRLHRLICYLHHSSHLVFACFLGDEVSNLRLAFYSDASFADDLQTSKSCIGKVLAALGPKSYVP